MHCEICADRIGPRLERVLLVQTADVYTDADGHSDLDYLGPLSRRVVCGTCAGDLMIALERAREARAQSAVVAEVTR